MYRISKPHIIKQQKIKQVVLDAVNTYQTAGASAFIKNAPDVSLTSKAYIDYNNNAQVYYNLGASGVTWSTVSDNPKLEFTLRKLGEKTAKEFFDAGISDNKILQNIKSSKKLVNDFEQALHSKNNPGVTVVANNLTKSQKAETELISSFAKSIGKEVIVVADTEEIGYGQANGFYKNGKIVLALNADGGLMSAYLGHELFHDLKVTSKAKAQQLEDFVVEYLKKQADYDYEERINKLIELNQFKGTREQQIEQANEEIAANACFTVLSEQKNFEKLAKQDKSLAQKVREFFADFIDKIKEALLDISSRNAEYKALKDDIKAKEKILAMFDECLNVQQKNNNYESSNVKYSLKKYSEKQIENWKNSKSIIVYESAEQLKAFCMNALNDNSFKKKLYFGAVTKDTAVKIKRLTDLDTENLNCCIRADEVRKILKNSHGNEKSEKLRGQRAITIEDIVSIPNIIQNADEIRRSKSDYEGKPVIEFVKEIDGKTTVISYVSKKHNDLTVQTMYAGLKDKKNRSLATTPSGDKSFSHTSRTLSGITSIDNVPQNDTAVNSNDMQENVKYSYKEDSEGNKLSEQQIKRYKNVAPELRDEQGRIKPFYHGTARADRVGNYFNPDRATSGPMAYFTDSEKIAGNYSRDKTDTSIAYDSDYDSYETQFRVNDNPITDYWYTLSPIEKRSLTQKIQQVTLDDEDNIVLDPDNKYGIGNFNDYELHNAKGNALQVLVDGWLGGGTLFGEEKRFVDVLNTIGIKNVEYKDPDYREEKVYKVYLNITNPFNTDNLNNEFISDLEDYILSADMSIYDKENSQADMWDKNSIDIYDWIERLKDDLSNGTTYAWTSIPDVVTDFLKEYGGYNGIIDKGGKNGGDIHTVAIPFYSNQIKNIDNTSPTDNVDIRYSRKEKTFKDALDKKEWKKFYAAIQKNNQYDHLRIGDNGILLPTDKANDYKLVYYYENSDKEINIQSVYRIENYDYNIHDKMDNPIKYLINVEEGWLNEKRAKTILQSYQSLYGTVFRKYSRQSNKFVNYTRNSKKSIQDNPKESDRTGVFKGIGEDRKQSIKEQPNNYHSLLTENEKLKKSVEYYKRMSKLSTQKDFKRNDIEKIAGKFKRDYNSNIDTDMLTNYLYSLYTNMANDEKTPFEVWQNTAKLIAQEIVDCSKQEINPENKAILNDLKQYTVSIDSHQRDEITYYYGGVGALTKKCESCVILFGR